MRGSPGNRTLNLRIKSLFKSVAATSTFAGKVLLTCGFSSVFFIVVSGRLWISRGAFAA
jgi:hypothetical protein